MKGIILNEAENNQADHAATPTQNAVSESPKDGYSLNRDWNRHQPTIGKVSTPTLMGIEFFTSPLQLHVQSLVP